MARGLAERFGAVVMRLRDREIGVHVAELAIHEVRLLPGSAVALNSKARVADEDFVDRGADRNWFVGGWRFGSVARGGSWMPSGRMLRSTSAKVEQTAATGERSRAAKGRTIGIVTNRLREYGEEETAKRRPDGSRWIDGAGQEDGHPRQPGDGIAGA
jgi:hypothetical protein